MSAAKPTPAVGIQPRHRVNNDADDAIETTALLPGAQPADAVHDDDASTWSGFKEFEGLPWWRTPSVCWLLGPYLLFTLAFGGIIVPKMNLILDLACRQYFADQTVRHPDLTIEPVNPGGDNPQCQSTEIQKISAMFFLLMNLCTGLLSAFVIPKLGHLSDRYGRRRLMALASCGGLTGELITILAAKFPDTVDYRWLLLGSILDGLAGSFTAGSVLCQSYTSDCTPPSRRAVSIGYVNACLFGGLAFGPLLASFCIKLTGSLLSIFYIALGCHVFFILFVGFVVPESVSKQRRKVAMDKWEKDRQAGRLRSASPIESLKILWPKGPGTSTALRVNLTTLALADTIIMGTSMAVGQVMIIYMRSMFHWGAVEMSQFVSAVSIVRVFILIGIFPVINYFGRTLPARRRQQATGAAVAIDKNAGADRMDLWVLRTALVSEIIGCTGYVLARAPPIFFLSAMATSMGALGSATIQATITKHVPADRVGQILGSVGSLHAISRVASPVLFNSLYVVTVDHFPQAIFVLLGSLFFCALIGTSLIKTGVHWDAAPEDEEDEEETLIAAEENRVRLAEESLVVGPQ